METKDADLPKKIPSVVHIYTDGSHRRPDASSCAYVVWDDINKKIVHTAAYAHRGATINQMELMAVNYALDLPDLETVVIYSDSAYTLASLFVWRKMWAKRGWIGVNGEPIKNADLIREIGAKIDKLKSCRYVKVKSHSGDKLNDMADKLATDLTRRMLTDSSIKNGKYDPI